MLAPISWIEDYTKVDVPLSKLMWRLTEAGLTCEKYNKTDGETVLDLEVTPNRPDWLNIIGIAREISVLTKNRLRTPSIPEIPDKKDSLKIDVNVDPKFVERYLSIIISDVVVKDSPSIIQKRLKLMGLRPINNLVDLTNYVMFEMGAPIHVFDYDKIIDKKILMRYSNEGEKFVSVDEKKYNLPAQSLVMEDRDRIIDLCGIKGGYNTSVGKNTKNIYIHVPVYHGDIIRKTSQKLKLASDASYIYERGVDVVGAVKSLNRIVDLYLRYSGGKVASKIIDIFPKEEEPIKIPIIWEDLDSLLGFSIDRNEAIDILKRLEIDCDITPKGIVAVPPSHRLDLNIPHDIAEEIARIWGYNNIKRVLPCTVPTFHTSTYIKDTDTEDKIKNTMSASGIDEIMTLSLVSEEDLELSNIPIDSAIELQNPVSNDYKYLRPSLFPGLISAVKLNSPIQEKIRLFEYSKIYESKGLKTVEPYKLSVLFYKSDYLEIKGIWDSLSENFNLPKSVYKPSLVKNSLWDPAKSAVIEIKGKLIGKIGKISDRVCSNYSIDNSTYGLEVDIDNFILYSKKRLYKPVSQYPPQIEDINIEPKSETPIGELINKLLEIDKVDDVSITDTYKGKITLRIKYLDKTKTMTNSEVKKVRNKIIQTLKEKYKTKTSYQ